MDQIVRRSLILLTVLALLGIGGCSDSSHGTLNGTVTFDGQPLKEGVVRFVPIDGKSQTASANITDGKFSAKLPVGEMRVEFSAPKVVGQHKVYDTPDSPMVDDVVDLIPPRFSYKSELKISVRKGTQDETFALTSK